MFKERSFRDFLILAMNLNSQSSITCNPILTSELRIILLIIWGELFGYEEAKPKPIKHNKS